MRHKTLQLYIFLILLTSFISVQGFAQKEHIFQFDTFRRINSAACFNKAKVIDLRAEKLYKVRIDTERSGALKPVKRIK